MRVAPICALSLVLALPSLMWAQEVVQHGTPDSPKALTNADVVNMVKAGLSADTIVMVIHDSAANFDTTADGLVALKKQGVPEKVIQEMLPLAGRSTSTTIQTSPLPVQNTDQRHHPGQEEYLQGREILLGPRQEFRKTMPRQPNGTARRLSLDIRLRSTS